MPATRSMITACTRATMTPSLSTTRTTHRLPSPCTDPHLLDDHDRGDQPRLPADQATRLRSASGQGKGGKASTSRAEQRCVKTEREIHGREGRRQFHANLFVKEGEDGKEVAAGLTNWKYAKKIKVK